MPSPTVRWDGCCSVEDSAGDLGALISSLQRSEEGRHAAARVALLPGWRCSPAAANASEALAIRPLKVPRDHKH